MEIDKMTNIEDMIDSNSLPVNSKAIVNRLIELMEENGTNTVRECRNDPRIGKILWLLNSQYYGQLATIDMCHEWDCLTNKIDSEPTIHMDPSLGGGTCFKGYLRDGITYDDIVKALGEPHGSDGYKSDAEWIGTIDGKVFTVYNYKTGKNYNGENGMDVSDMTGDMWHVGGKDPDVVELVNDYIINA